MKRSIKYIVIMISLLILCSCSSKQGNNKISSANNVKNVIDNQISADDNQINLEESTKASNAIDQNETTTESVTNTTEEQTTVNADVDIDLTQMGSDMVYATVYQMMVNPDSYVGKTIKMSGNYSVSWYDATSKYYHFVIIRDAAACCAQGIEFVWDDGKHVYPDEYPSEGDEIEVTGVFETYTEEGDSSLYCRLKDATLKKIEK